MVKLRVTLIFILSFSYVYAQLPQFSLYQNGIIPDSRRIILLNNKWSVVEEDFEKRNVNIPVFFDDDRITLKNEFEVESKGNNEQYYLHFRGVTGLEELYINDERIPFDPSEIERYTFNIPENLIQLGQKNFLKIILSKNKRIKEQKSITANLLLAERKIGIFKDVYLEVLPPIAITKVNLKSSLEKNFLTGKIFYHIELNQSVIDSLLQQIELKISVRNKLTGNIEATKKELVDLRTKSKIIISEEIQVKNPQLWSNVNPSYYLVEIELLDGLRTIDSYFSQLSFRSVELEGNKFLLNGVPILVQGVTYFESNGVKNSFFNLREYSRDIRLIKELNANAVLFKNSIPSEEILREFEKNGILVFIEIDSRFYHPKINLDLLNEFKAKASFVIDHFSNYGCIVGLGLNASNFGLDEKLSYDLINFIRNSKINFLIFGVSDQVKNAGSDLFDFISINLLHKSISDIRDIIANLDKNKFVLINSFGHMHDLNQKEGYSNKYSYQAQAKYVSDVLRLITGNKFSFFVHTLVDYRVGYHSIISGKYDDRLIKFGLVNEYRDNKKLSYSTVKSYLTDTELPLIMQGSYSESANVIFVFTGLLLLALSIIVINSTARFRENVSRAVLKTYNFFSDIRDGWFISSFHSIILGLLIMFSIALLYSSFLFYLKDVFWFEKLISLFNCPIIFELFSFISWRPMVSIFYLTALGIIFTFLIVIVIKFFNLFMRHKVFLNQIFMVVIWSSIPFLISIPLGMVAFKILSQEKYNLILFIVFVLFHLWVLSRILDGISIIFEKRKSKINFISIIFILVIIASLSLILQSNYGSISYFIHFFG